jgi:hypothetical protein
VHLVHARRRRRHRRRAAGLTWLYFALSQFPIYLSPQLLKPIVGRLSATGREGEG